MDMKKAVSSNEKQIHGSTEAVFWHIDTVAQSIKRQNLNSLFEHAELQTKTVRNSCTNMLYIYFYYKLEIGAGLSWTNWYTRAPISWWFQFPCENILTELELWHFDWVIIDAFDNSHHHLVKTLREKRLTEKWLKPTIFHAKFQIS